MRLNFKCVDHFIRFNLSCIQFTVKNTMAPAILQDHCNAFGVLRKILLCNQEFLYFAPTVGLLTWKVISCFEINTNIIEAESKGTWAWIVSKIDSEFSKFNKFFSTFCEDRICWMKLEGCWFFHWFWGYRRNKVRFPTLFCVSWIFSSKKYRQTRFLTTAGSKQIVAFELNENSCGPGFIKLMFKLNHKSYLI